MELLDVAQQMPILTRVAVGLVGALLWIAGARWYERAILMSAFAMGAVLTTSAVLYATEWLGVVAEPMVLAVSALVVGGMAAGLARLAHRWTLAAVGAIAGGTATASLATAVTVIPLWATLIGVLVGALVFPRLWHQLLKVLTPAVGAVCLVWALGMPDHPALIGVLWVVGSAIQLFGGRKRTDPEGDA